MIKKAFRIFLAQIGFTFYFAPAEDYPIFYCHSVNSFTLFFLNKISHFLFEFYHVGIRSTLESWFKIFSFVSLKLNNLYVFTTHIIFLKYQSEM